MAPDNVATWGDQRRGGEETDDAARIAEDGIIARRQMPGVVQSISGVGADSTRLGRRSGLSAGKTKWFSAWPRAALDCLACQQLVDGTTEVGGTEGFGNEWEFHVLGFGTQPVGIA